MAFMQEFQHLKIKLEDIKSATNNFSEENYIGGGGFGKVYKGEVCHYKGRSMAAFKRLDRKHGQGEAEFSKEIMTLSSYRHKNIISLLGYCNEDGEMILVYEYACNGSLDRHLNNAALTWRKRLKICLEAAKALEYLHDPKGTHQRVIHRDIKSGNILLCDNWVAKLADLGLSKMGPANQDQTFLISSAVGTLGYCDPMYIETGLLTKESDVYSFGVLLFEVLYGRSCFNTIAGSFGQLLVPTWKKNYVEKKIDGIHILQDMDPSSLKLFSDIAYRCVEEFREDRPKMAEVVTELEIALDISQEMSEGKTTDVIDYEEMVKTVVPPLNYRFKAELMIFLSKGVLLNGGTTWFSLNAKGQHIEMISIAHCMTVSYIKGFYTTEYNSRFKQGSYNTANNKLSIRTRVETQFLSAHITYVVNLVFKYQKPHNRTISRLWLGYNLEADNYMLESYYSYQREDGWFIVELYQFNSDQGMVDLEIQFQQLDSNYLLIEGIEFRPLEEQVVEHVSSSPSEEDDSEDESFWERKLPIDYQHLIKLSRDTTIMRFKTYKELYSILCKGFLVKGGLEWVSVDKNGNICVMQAPEAVFANDRRFKKWHHLPESRFGKMLEVFDTRLKFEGKIISRVLSLQTTYACYLVYKIVSGLTFYRFPLKVSDATDLASGDWKVPDIRYIFLYVPQTPVIVGGKADRDIYKPLNKTNLKGIPILRSDGLMEVQLFEYQAASGKKIPTHLAWYNEHNVKLEGLIIEGIEFRPI